LSECQKNMKRIFITFWIDKEKNYKLPSISFKSRYNINFKEFEYRKIILPENFIKAFNENWSKYYNKINIGQEGYLYKSEISINI